MKYPTLPSSVPSINYHHLGFAFCLGVIGLLINLFPVPLFANVALVLGNTATVIVAILLGPWYALFTAFIAVSGLMLVWDSPHVYLIFTVEAVFLGLARRRDIYALYASGIYWLLLGGPLLYLYFITFVDISSGHLPFAIIKQVINGLICASLASIIIILTPQLWHFKGKIKDKHRRHFSSQLTYSVTLLITLCLLFSSLVYNYLSLDKQQTLLSENLEETAEHIAKATDKYLINHRKVIENAAKLISIANTEPSEWQTWLNNIHSHYPNFVTMLIANSDARVVAAAPEALFNTVKDNKTLTSIEDREYFVEAFHHQRAFVSSAFIGRGFGNDPIVAISAPVYANVGLENKPQTPVGIIEGSLNLKNFDSIDEHNRYHKMQGLIILDSNNKVVYASKSLTLTLMSDFQYSDDNVRFKTKLNLINIHQLEAFTPEYIHAKRRLANGWQVLVLDPFSPLIDVAEAQLFNSFLLLLISLFISFMISKRISLQLTEPLDIIAHQFSQLNDKDVKEQLLDEGTPIEINSLYHQLTLSKKQLITHQLELEEVVALRTLELEEANKKLLVLVDRDALTGIYNRRFAENKFDELREFCQRSHQAITIAILDLDFFKKVNDTYGHQAGDECLRRVAACLEEHFARDTDIVARFGGEEFILILPISNALHIEQHLNSFREALAALVIQSPQDDEHSFSVSASIGAITANADYNKSLDTWLKVADDNLYLAKEQGRNCVIVSLISDQLTDGPTSNT